MSESELEGNKLHECIANVVNGVKCILFLGAGVHAPPPLDSPFKYPEDERPPMSGRLSELLTNECAFVQNFPLEPIYDLERISLCYKLTCVFQS